MTASLTAKAGNTALRIKCRKLAAAIYNCVALTSLSVCTTCVVTGVDSVKVPAMTLADCDLAYACS